MINDETPMKRQYDTSVNADDMIEGFEQDIQKEKKNQKKKGKN